MLRQWTRRRAAVCAGCLWGGAPLRSVVSRRERMKEHLLLFAALVALGFVLGCAVRKPAAPQFADLPIKSQAQDRDARFRNQRVPAGCVRLVGEVKHPGIYPFRTALTLDDVVEQAGGLCDFAGSFEIYHRDRTKTTQRLKRVWTVVGTYAKELDKIVLREGDCIVIHGMCGI